MNVKDILKIGGAIVGAYWIGKIAGAELGAKQVLKKYSEVIPEDSFEVCLIDRKHYFMSMLVKK